MPIYDYKCSRCGVTEERVAKVDDHIVVCPCGSTMTRQFHSSFGIGMGVGAYGYFDETLGRYIATNKQRRDEMRKQGVSEKIGKGWR